MHEVRCETCGKVLGIITDKMLFGRPIYEGIETVVLGDDGAFIDGGLGGSGGTYCTDHAPRQSKPKSKQTIPLAGVLPKRPKLRTQSSTPSMRKNNV